MVRVMDEAVEIAGLGVLLILEEDADVPPQGCRLRDARGREHVVAQVDRQDGLVTLLIEGGDIGYFDRLFRDVRVDATGFWVVDESP